MPHGSPFPPILIFHPSSEMDLCYFTRLWDLVFKMGFGFNFTQGSTPKTVNCLNRISCDQKQPQTWTGRNFTIEGFLFHLYYAKYYIQCHQFCWSCSLTINIACVVSPILNVNLTLCVTPCESCWALYIYNNTIIVTS